MDPFVEFHQIFGKQINEIETEYKLNTETKDSSDDTKTPDFVFEYFAYSFNTVKAKFNRDFTEYECGNRIIVPESLYPFILQNKINEPPLFKFESDLSTNITHVSVLEYSVNEPNIIYIPNWMMKSYDITEYDENTKSGATVKLTLKNNNELKKCSYIKVKPLDKGFYDIDNQSSLLEKALKKYGCLTVGDTMRVDNNGTELKFDIVELMSKFHYGTSELKAVDIIDTDCIFDIIDLSDNDNNEEKIGDIKPIKRLKSLQFQNSTNNVSEYYKKPKNNVDDITDDESLISDVDNKLDDSKDNNNNNNSIKKSGQTVASKLVKDNNKLSGIQPKLFELDKSKKTIRFRVALFNNKRETITFNQDRTILELYQHIKAISKCVKDFQLIDGVPPRVRVLSDLNESVKDAGLNGGSIRQKVI